MERRKFTREFKLDRRGTDELRHPVAHRRQILPQQILSNLDGFDNYAIRNHAKTTRTRLFWLGELSEVLFVPGMGRMAK